MKDLKFDELGNMIGEDGTIIKTKEEIEKEKAAEEAAKKAQDDELNRRLEEKIAERLAEIERQKAEELEEAEKLKNMDEAEKKLYELTKKLEETEKELKERKKGELKATTEKILIERGLSTELTDFIDLSDANTAMEGISKLQKILNESVTNEVNKKIQQSQNIPGSGGNNQKTEDQLKEDHIRSMFKLRGK